MHIDWWTLALQTVNVLVLLFLLKRFLLKPVLAMIDARQQAVARDMDAASRARAEAEAAKADTEKRLAAIEAVRAARLGDAQKDAEALRAAALKAAGTQADALRLAAMADIERARAADEQAMADHAGALALSIAERLLQRLPETLRTEAFLEPLALAIAALPAESRALIAGADTVELKTAAPLAAAQADAFRDRIAGLVGAPLAVFSVTVDPDLVAGLDLVTPHLTVRNSFRADLETIQRELSGHAL